MNMLRKVKQLIKEWGLIVLACFAILCVIPALLISINWALVGIIIGIPSMILLAKSVCEDTGIPPNIF